MVAVRDTFTRKAVLRLELSLSPPRSADPSLGSYSTPIRQSAQIQNRNSKTITGWEGVATAVRPSHSGSTLALSLKPATLFSNEPSYHSFSAVLNLNNELIGDRFANWEQDVTSNNEDVEVTVVGVKAHPMDTLSVAFFIYDTDRNGRKSLEFSPLRLIHEEVVPNNLKRHKKNTPFLEQRNHPFRPERINSPSPRPPPSSSGRTSRFSSNASATMDSKFASRSPRRQASTRETSERRSGSRGFQSLPPQDETLPEFRLEKEEKENQELRMKVRQKRHGVKELKREIQRAKDLAADLRALEADDEEEQDPIVPHLQQQPANFKTPEIGSLVNRNFENGFHQREEREDQKVQDSSNRSHPPPPTPPQIRREPVEAQVYESDDSAYLGGCSLRQEEEDEEESGSGRSLA